MKRRQIHWSWSRGSKRITPCQKTGRRENQTESNTEEGQSERGKETRSHMLKEEGCGDKTSDFRALPWLLAKVCLPRWDDLMTCEKMQYNTQVRDRRMPNESKWPAAIKITLTDTSVKKWTAFVEWESQSSNSFNTKRDGSNQLRPGLKKLFLGTTMTVSFNTVLWSTARSGSDSLSSWYRK